MKNKEQQESQEMTTNVTGAKSRLETVFHNIMGDSITHADLSGIKSTESSELTDSLSLGDIINEAKNLESLDISNNKFRSGKLKSLCEALESNTHIKTLNLSNNQLDDEKITYIAGVISENKSITKLNLSSNIFGIKGLKMINHALSQNNIIKSIKMDKLEVGVDNWQDFHEQLESIKVILERNGGNVKGTRFSYLGGDKENKDPAISKKNIRLSYVDRDTSRTPPSAKFKNRNLEARPLANLDVSQEYTV